jgi:regulation of enolase protein 1 (concanavalin A-like superfamily)/uridine kinase
MKYRILIFCYAIAIVSSLQAQTARINITPRIDSVVSKITSTINKKTCTLVAIGGEDLSGRTQLTDDIYQELSAKGLNVVILHLPQYRVPFEQCLKNKNPGKYFYENEVNFSTLNKDVLQPLKKSRKLSKKVKLNGVTPSQLSFNNADVALIEGAMVDRKIFAKWFDLRIWVDCSMQTLRDRYALRPAGNDPVQQKKIIDEVLLMAHNQQIIIDQPSIMVDYTFIADDRMRKEPQIILNEDFKGKKLNAKLTWLNPPKVWKLVNNALYVETDAVTDFWQRTFYGFSNDNGHFLYYETDKDFVLTTHFKYEPKNQFDQAGIAIRIDEDNWLKASVEYELQAAAKLGSVVTNNGYSDWATQSVPNSTVEMTWKITRIGKDFFISYLNAQGIWEQVRVAHLDKAGGNVKCGIYGCSPIDKGYKIYYDFLKIEELVR